jgi:hypothetical protein
MEAKRSNESIATDSKRNQINVKAPQNETLRNEMKDEYFRLKGLGKSNPEIKKELMIRFAEALQTEMLNEGSSKREQKMSQDLVDPKVKVHIQYDAEFQNLKSQGYTDQEAKQKLFNRISAGNG